MYIIFGTKNAETLRERHIVLELETFTVDGAEQVAYCVVQPESIALGEMPDIERLSGIHQATVDALNRKDYATVMEGVSHLKGCFGGELDSFYTIISDRIKEITVEQPQT